ncbi:MAG: hypothetical protein WCY29_00200 [Novosphingobium sp.]
MRIITATGTVDETGPLTRIVNDYCETHARLASSGASTPEEWAPWAEFVDTANFKRVGAYLEELDWHQYLQFIIDWAGGTKFEMTVFHVTEVGDTVFQEIEERHYHGDTFIRKNVMAVYRFNADNKIRHLDIYEQATDSGQWIKEAASSAMETGGG